MRKSARHVQEEIEHYAIEIAEGYNFHLDYSVASIKDVEKVLTKLYIGYRDSDDKTGMRGVAMEFGCYIVSVIEKNFSEGTFRRDHEEYGDDTYPFDWNDKTLFPYVWCMKRISDGPQDNVWKKFEVLVLEKDKRGNIFKEIYRKVRGLS